ncbi:LysR family transcriptional regulator [Stackebrandtia soli]|uniref:LysR family transcriptional regulator n=1 Tax=Stackebrandtia soli TaxID=1892856 RepID=UPI0039EAB155
MLERQEIDVLLALAEELHFGRTAARVRLTTGQVSKILKRIERRCGTDLFERTSRVVRLTPVGATLTSELRPLVEGIDAAVRRAVDAGRGVTGVIRVGFMGAGTEQLVLNAVNLFAARHPECDVHIYEAQYQDSRPSLVDGTTDVIVAAFPYPGMVEGPVLMSEPRLLAVSTRHPLARHDSVSVEVFADHPVVQLPTDMAEEFRRDRTPARTPSGRPTLKGPVGATFGDMLTLAALGKGVYPVGAYAARYRPRPDLVYVPIHDAPPIRSGPVWRATNDTARVRAFVRAAVDANLDPNF